VQSASVTWETKIKLKSTGRILVYDLSEFAAIHLWEVVAVDVLLELCISPGVAGDYVGRGIILRTETYSRNVETGYAKNSSFVVAIS
jgi:hypothetical protein